MSSIVTLDTEKHSEVRRSQRHRLDYSTGSEGLSDDDEFGGASDNEAPDSKFLTTLENEYEEELDVLPTLLRLTNSQLQAHLPMGLDNEKHEDIGGMLLDASAKAVASKKLKDESISSSNNSTDEFGDADDHDLPAPQRLTESDHDPPETPPSDFNAHIPLGPLVPLGIDSEKHEEIGNLMDSRHSDILETTHEILEEFGDANENDVPVNKYLQDAKELILMEGKVFAARVTPSQLQAFIPSGLDNEKHEEIGDLMDSRHDNEDEDEFGDADEHDIPHKRFLHDSTHSISFEEFEEFGSRRAARIRGTDAGKHDGTKNIHPTDANNQERFGKAKKMDHVVDRNLDQWKNSGHDENENDDDLESDIEYEDLKGSDTLDTAQHEDLGDLNQVVSDGEDEFELGGEHDVPVSKYLLSQHSSHGDDALSYGQDQALQGLDHETHEDLGGFRMTSMSDDEEEFECADSFDKPSSAFLKHQVSIQDDEFLSPEEIQQVEHELAN